MTFRTSKKDQACGVPRWLTEVEMREGIREPRFYFDTTIPSAGWDILPRKQHVWGPGFPDEDYRRTYRFARPATEEEINSARSLERQERLRRESLQWIEKTWGRTRLVHSADGVEIWEGEAKAGRRTSFHRHPRHDQNVILLFGVMEVASNGGRVILNEPRSACAVTNGVGHELRFSTPVRFLEIYTLYGSKPASVRDTIERIYQ